MRNAKKTLSMMMVAIFTTFIVLSGIPASAATTAQAKAQVTKATAAVVKVEKVVKVSTFNPTTAKSLNAAATKEVAKVNKLGKTYKATYLKLVARYQAVNKKIAVRIAYLANTNVFASADKAVTAAEKATDGDEVDLVGDPAALTAAQAAITNALELIVKLDKNSANYKGLMARVDAANGLIVKAMEEITAAEEAAKLAAEAKAKLEAAVAAAETAVKAVEAAPLATEADLTAVLALGVTAKTAVEAVTDVAQAEAFAARLKVVADKGLALKAKLAADAEALKPATILTVSAVDGTITVTFDKKVSTPTAVDFKVTRTVTTDSAVTTPVAFTMTVVSDTAITFTVPAVAASTTDQSVVYSVQYTTGAAVAAKVGYTVAKLPVLVVDSVTATNLKEIYVTFNKDVDKTTAETKTNYTLSAGTVASATLTGKVVTLTLTAAAANQATVDVTVKNVKDASGIAITTVTKSLTFLDVTLPTANSYAFTGPQTIEITCSEPIKTAGTVLIDNGIYGATATADGNVITVALGTVLPEGAHTLKLSGYADDVYTGIDKVFNIVYAKDTTLPTVALKSATQTKVTLTFNKPVKGDALATTSFYHTFTSYAPTSVKDAAGLSIVTTQYYDTVVLDFTDRPLPAGTVNVVVLKTVGTITITDGYGNKMAADAVIPVTITADTTAPTLTKVEATNESTLALTYSEDVTGAATKANYVVKKADGTVVDSATYSVTYNATTFVATVAFTTPLTGGAYSVTVSNVKDTSLSANALASSAIAFTVSDKTPITAATAIAVESTGTTADIIYVTFPENMATTGVNSVLDASNYKIGTSAATAVALADGTTITVFGTNDKVKVTIPGTSSADLTGKHLYVRNLSDAVGNVMTALYVDITPDADVAPVVTAIKTTALNTFTMTVDKQLSSLNAADIKVDMAGDGSPVVVAQATYANNSDGTSTITVVVPAAEALASEGLLPGVVEITANGTCKSITGTAMKADDDLTADNAGDATAADRNLTPADGVAPAFASTNAVTTYDTNGNGQIDKIVVAYTEAINLNTVSYLTYTVAGYTVTAVGVSSQATAALAAVNVTGANGNFVVLSVTELTTNDTSAMPAVTQAYAIKDVAGNTLAAQAAKTAVDTAAPVMTSAKLYDGTTNLAKAAGTAAVANDYILVTFSEAITTSTIDTTAAVASIDGADFKLMRGSAGAGDTALNAGTTATVSVVDSKTVKITIVAVNAADTSIANGAAAANSDDVLTLKVGTVTDAATTPVVNAVQTIVIK